MLPPKKAVRSDPKTAGQVKTIEEDEDKDDAAKEKDIDKLAKILEKDLKYVEWKEKAQYITSRCGLSQKKFGPRWEWPTRSGVSQVSLV